MILLMSLNSIRLMTLLLLGYCFFQKSISRIFLFVAYFRMQGCYIHKNSSKGLSYSFSEYIFFKKFYIMIYLIQTQFSGRNDHESLK